MQFRRQCRLENIGRKRTPGDRLRSVAITAALPAHIAGICASIILLVAVTSSDAPVKAEDLQVVQLGSNEGRGPSYGYQPYDDRNPTGFFHPNGMGYGHYYLTQKHHAARFRAFRYQKFRGTRARAGLASRPTVRKHQRIASTLPGLIACARTTTLTEQRARTFTTGATPVAGWFVTAGHPLVRQRFYAAVDGTGRLCWTDDPAAAAQFPLARDAERFAHLMCPHEDWSVSR